MLKSLASLQISHEFHNFQEPINKKSLQKIDSFEIEGPDAETKQKTDKEELSLNEKQKMALSFNLQPTPPINDNLEYLYDIRKSTNIKVSTLIEEESENNDQTKDDIQKSDTSTITKDENSKTFRRGFSYSDFEGGGEDKRKVTYDKQYQQQKKKSLIMKVKQRFRTFFDFPSMKTKFENSFVDVVITCTINII